MNDSKPGEVEFYSARFCTCDGAVITDPDLLQLYSQRLPNAARSWRTLYFSGEAGTGKRLMAGTAHLWSNQRGKLRHVDCAYEKKEQLQNLLFGDPRRATRGAVAEAAGGSLLLTNFDYLPLPLQERVARGRTRLLLTSRAPLAVALASGRLHPEVAQGVLQEIQLPPLRVRPGAPSELFVHFVEEMGPRSRPGYKPPIPNAAALEELSRRHWPGNVAELRLLVKHLLYDFKQGFIGPEDLPAIDPTHFSRPRDLRQGAKQLAA